MGGSGNSVVGAVLVAAALSGACSPPRPATEPAPPAASPPSAPAIATPAALSRPALLEAVRMAADAAAAGAAYPDSLKEIAGRRFALRVPFGCFGPTSEDADVSYAFDPEKNVVRLTARPIAWSGEDWTKAVLDIGDAEAAEGFWLRRPWLMREVCPTAPPFGEPEAETVALVEVFEAGGSRVLRRSGRPYEVTRKVGGEGAPRGGFRLVLEGRLAAGDDGLPIHCLGQGADRRPVCFVQAAFERVAFEDAAGETLAEWKP